MLMDVRVPEVCDAIAMSDVTCDAPQKSPFAKTKRLLFHPLPALFDFTNDSRVRKFLIEVYLNGILSDR